MLFKWTLRWKEAAALAVILCYGQVGFAEDAIQIGTLNKPVVAPSPAVRDVAANPTAHLGQLRLSGVVGIVTPHKGFVLIDMREYQSEGLNCLTTAEKTKIPVLWSGAAPKVEEPVRVDGTLARTAAGYVFTATGVTP